MQHTYLYNLNSCYGPNIATYVSTFQKNLFSKINFLAQLCFLKFCLRLMVIPKGFHIRNKWSAPKSIKVLRKCEISGMKKQIRYLYANINKCKLLEDSYYYLIRENFKEEDRNHLCNITFNRAFTLSQRFLVKHKNKLWNLICLENSSANLDNYDEFYFVLNGFTRYLEPNNYKFQGLYKLLLRNNFDVFELKYLKSAKDIKNVINLSSRYIPLHVLEFLSNGYKYALGGIYSKQDLLALAADTELISQKLEQGDNLRKEIVTAINNYRPAKNQNMHTRSLKFIKHNKDLVFSRFDKGNGIVIMDRERYEEKMQALLNDSNIYVPLRSDQTIKVQAQLNSLLNTWYRNQYIDKSVLKNIKCTSSQAPSIYGIPKIHKPNIPLRPIVNFTKSPLYNLSKFMSNCLKQYTSCYENSVKKTTNLISELKEITIGPDDKMISLDVEALYTSIPISLALDVLNSTLTTDLISYQIPKIEFVKMIEFCLSTTYFEYLGKFYKQAHGCPMGSSLSVRVAEIVMMSIETKALDSLKSEIKFYRRYVDDCLLVINSSSEDLIVKTFNDQHPSLNFTYEEEKENSIPFLDILITKNEQGSLTISVYKKPTDTNRYWNATSKHPRNHKHSLIASQFRRVLLYIDDHQKQLEEFEKIKNLFNMHNFSDSMIDESFRIAYNSIHKSPANSIENRPRIPLKYIGAYSNKFKKIFNKYSIDIAFKPINQISKFIGSHRKRPLVNDGVVYAIECLDCHEHYVGQTARPLQVRIKEHSSALKNLNVDKSALSEHLLSTGHFNFAIDNPMVLAKEDNGYRRRFMESYFIEVTKNFNRKQEIKELNPIFKNIDLKI